MIEMNNSQPMVYIIVLNYQNVYDTIECLNSLIEQDYQSYKIVLVDNASQDDSVKKLSEYAKKNDVVTFIESPRNGGYAAGNNMGILYAQQQGDMDYVWILNNDTVVEKDALSKVVEKAYADKEIGLCGSKLIYSWNRDLVQAIGGKYNKFLGIGWNVTDESLVNNLDYANGAAVLVSKYFLDDVGLMCEEYFLYYEEIDWALRAKGKYKITCALDSIVYHKEGASIGGSDAQKNNKSELADYFSIRNRLLVSKKYYKIYVPIVYFGLLIAVVNRIKRCQFSRIGMIISLALGSKNKKYEIV